MKYYECYIRIELINETLEAESKHNTIAQSMHKTTNAREKPNYLMQHSLSVVACRDPRMEMHFVFCDCRRQVYIGRSRGLFWESGI